MVGNRREVRYAVLTGLFLLTCFFVYGWQRETPVVSKPDMASFFSRIGTYTRIREIPLLEDHVAMLKLDSYLFGDYRDPRGRTVNLYIGYYFSASKAYAAHSPLVCYPSQGWKIDRKAVRSSLAVGEHTINYEEIVTSLGENSELVAYWYQAGPYTATQVYRNKMLMGYNKLMTNNEQHGFIRITVSLRNRTIDQAREIVRDFMGQFYPLFVRYVALNGTGGAGQDRKQPLAP